RATRARRKSNASLREKNPAFDGRLEKSLCGSLSDLGIPIRSISGRRITWVSWRWMNWRIAVGFAWNGPRARRWWAGGKWPMKKAELEVAAEMIGEAGDAVEMILTQGIDAAMTKYNRRKPADPEELEEK